MKISRFVLYILIIANSIILHACSSNTNKIEPQIENFNSIQIHSTEFAINLLKSTSKTLTDSNFVISPFTAQLTLSMIGNLMYYDRICEIFGTENIDKLNNVNKFISDKLTTPLVVDASGDTLSTPTKLSNGVWFNTQMLNNAKEKLQKYYNADVNQVDLTSNNGSKVIQSWLSQAVVEENIRPSISKTDNTDLMISSVIYLNNQWDGDYHFSTPYKERFLSPRGDQNTDYITANIQTNYFINDDSENILLDIPPYKIIFIKPIESSLPIFINNFNTSDLQEIISNATQHNIKLSIPVFEISSNYSLIPLFQSIGINFKANDSHSDNTYPLIQADQISTIRVDDNGVAAGSVTLFYITFGLQDFENPIVLNLNRPFIYFIIEPETQAILMAGQYTGPEE